LRPPRLASTMRPVSKYWLSPASNACEPSHGFHGRSLFPANNRKMTAAAGKLRRPRLECRDGVEWVPHQGAILHARSGPPKGAPVRAGALFF
jgi:hypothetical protein